MDKWHEVHYSDKTTHDKVRICCLKEYGAVFVDGQFKDAIKYCPMCGEKLPEKEYVERF
ncbi:MAG: hypothetical protein WC489_09000 [Patescibacteria group bacterium]